jgi:curved DNA-binding protein CbpA
MLMEVGDCVGAMNNFHTLRKSDLDDKTVAAYLEKLARIEDQDRQISHCAVLGLNPNASDAEIKAAFRQAVLKSHSARYRDGMDTRKAEKKMGAINEAYEPLSDQELKKEYDVKLLRRSTPKGTLRFERNKQPNRCFLNHVGRRMGRCIRRIRHSRMRHSKRKPRQPGGDHF